VIERVTVIKFRMDNGGGNGAGCFEDRMMICGIVLRQHRNVTDDRRHPHAI